MQVISELKHFSPDRDTLLTVGVFDGVHLGHRQLLNRLVMQAAERNLSSGVVTFRDHPKTVISPESRLARLTTLEERTRLLKDIGIDIVVPLTFSTEFAALSAREFVILLQEHLNMQGLVIGPDFALGKGRTGDAATLTKLGKELGFTVDAVGPMTLEGSPVSSTAIRGALARGDMKTTTKLLGRNFTLNGMVEGGTERGHILGFPTANISVDRDQALPSDGVYATMGHIGDRVYKSVTNIGVRPTFNGRERTIEVFLMDFDEDIYGKELTIELIERLRGERKFASVEELSAQISRDVNRAHEILSQPAGNGM